MLADAVDPAAFDEQPRSQTAGPHPESGTLQIVPLDEGMNLAILQEPVPRELLRQLLHTLAERYGPNWRPERSAPPDAH
jgi:hypothetical protein